jgi:hypothetical protein
MCLNPSWFRQLLVKQRFTGCTTRVFAFLALFFFKEIGVSGKTVEEIAVSDSDS